MQKKYLTAAVVQLLKRTGQLCSLGLVVAVTSQASFAACTYTIESEWNSGFTANISIKNDTGAALNNWAVNWQYATNRMSSGWNANFTGSNPYSASNLSWNGSIAVGQSVSFGVQGEKNGGAAERPTINGAACGGTVAVSSSRANSSVPVVTSSSSRSSTPSQTAFLIQESQAGFCRVDGTIDTNNAGFTGTGFANTNNAQGAAVVWAVEATTSGRQTLTFRYSNGGAATRNGSLVINGGSNGNYTLSLPVTASWTDWQTVAIEVDLVQGNNILQLSALTADGLPNIDSLTLTGGSVKAGNCGTVSTSSAQASSRSSSSSSVAAIGNPVLSVGCGKARTLQNGRITLQSGGISRSYILDVPTNYTNTHPYRVVFGFHWRGGNAEDVATGRTVSTTTWQHYGLKRLAGDTTIFVAPEGIANGWANSGGSDVVFTDNILVQLKNNLCIDESRVFANGFSFGGAMSYALGCARAKTFRAIAAYGAGAVSGCSGGADPIAYFGGHGVQDGVFPPSVGQGLRNKFVANNKCTAMNPIEPAAGSRTHICTSYQCPDKNLPVRWCAYDAGHDASPVDGQFVGGGATWLPAEAWKFFTQF